MARTTAPLLSLSASGSIAKAIVYSTWKGVDYARQHVIPSNPKSSGQVSTRNAFKWTHDQYKYLPTDVTVAWEAYAKGKPMTGPNAFLQANVPVLRGAANNNNIIFAKPVAGGPPTPSLVATPGSTTLAVTVTAPDVPAGWTIVNCTMIVMKQVTTFGELEQNISQVNVDTTAPYSHTFTGLTNGQVYVVGAFFTFTRADGTTAYGGSLNITATPAP